MVSYSPELSPDCGTQQCAGAAAFYNDTLYYIGNGHDATIWVLSRTCGADSLDPTEDPGDEQKYWTQKLRYEPAAPSSQTGVWSWTELTGWVTDANGSPLPNAATG